MIARPADRSRLRPTLGGILVVTLILQLLPVIGRASDDADPLHDFFVDDDHSIHEGYLNALGHAGLLKGCNPPANDRVCPDRAVTRGELATVLVRAFHPDAPPAATVFQDVRSSVHRKSIGVLAERGVIRGCNPPKNTRFCPEGAVTRGQAAALINRSLDLSARSAGSLPRGLRFKDVPNSIFLGDIQAVVSSSIMSACNPPGGDRFCPNRRVSRAELASIVGRALGLTPIEIERSGAATTTSMPAEPTATESTPPTTSGSVPPSSIPHLVGNTSTTTSPSPTTKLSAPPALTTTTTTPPATTTTSTSTTTSTTTPSTTTTLSVPTTTSPSTTTSTTSTTVPSTTTTTTMPPTTTTSSPTTTLPPTSTSTSVPAVSSSGQGAFAGEPAPGTLYWGAHTTRHEAGAGHSLGVQRSFFQWNQRTGSVVRTIQDDIAHGRLSWVSLKTPSWAAMGAGRHDDEIDELLLALKDLKVDIWLTMHHEPEGGGGVNSPDDPAGPAGHLAMNRRVRERMTALNVDNVALAPILMTWSWASASGRNPDEWWDSSVYDFLGVDHYMSDDSSLVTSRWYDVRAWAAARGVSVAVGEWGLLRSDAVGAARVQEWFDHAADSHRDGRGARVVALAYFDSDKEYSGKVWALQGQALEKWKQLLHDPRNADPK